MSPSLPNSPTEPAPPSVDDPNVDPSVEKKAPPPKEPDQHLPSRPASDPTIRKGPLGDPPNKKPAEIDPPVPGTPNEPAHMLRDSLRAR